MKWILGIALLALTGCVSQNEIALSQNVYKLDVNARGLIAMNEAQRTMQKRAAELTLSKGYTHYVIADARTAEGARYLGNTPMYGTTAVYVYGNTAYGTTNIYGGQPIVQPHSNTSLIVVMFHEANAPSNALDARLGGTGQ